MPPIPAALLEQIKATVGPRGWEDDPAALAPHLVDQRGRYRGTTPLLVRPASTAEVATVVRLCHEAGVPVVPQGGNTGLVGGSVPDEDGRAILLCLSRMDRIRSVDAVDFSMTVEAGCVLAAVQAAADEAGLLFPLSLAAEGSCQIGGNLSTNAGGTAVLRYGNARDLVLGLEVVLPDGRVWDGLRRLRKDNTGYCLRHLFLGAEGTLGIITAAVLKLYPRPRQVETCLAAVQSPEAALELLTRLRQRSGDQVSTFEYMNRVSVDLVLRRLPGAREPFAAPHAHYVLAELTSAREGADLRTALEQGVGEALDAGAVLDAVIAQSGAQRETLWRMREGIPEAQRLDGAGIKHDVAVPVSRVPEFLERAGPLVTGLLPGALVVAFGHLGDGNIHFNLNQPGTLEREAFLAAGPRVNRAVHDLVMEMEGSFSAEHGIGRLKRTDLARYRSQVELDLMRAVKAALDPRDVMNPGRVV